MNFIKICNKIIEYSFYALFLLVPLVFTSNTSELFEFNKLWLTFGLTVIIVTSWLVKMVLQKKVEIVRTPLDIPILLFLLSQVLATIHSLDLHTSLWGYYSRFNGGLLSTIDYVFLYYALLSNFKEFDPDLIGVAFVKRLLHVGLFSGLIVSLWGLPSHFGYDPTCLLFRGSFDVSCWTDQFQPKVRIFSTLGQPDWLGAYLAILIPVALALGISLFQQKKEELNLKSKLFAIGYVLLSILFYLDLTYTKSRSAFAAIWISLVVFSVALLWPKRSQLKNILKNNLGKTLIVALLTFILISFFQGTSFSTIDKFTLNGLKESAAKKAAKQEVKPPVFAGELGGTDSLKIRLIVWKGAVEAWKHNPIFGTGVETFAFAYYLYRPEEHNMTSEWDYLYNKAHNEYLNFLATTGAVGLLSYLFVIAAFLFAVLGKQSALNKTLGILRPKPMTKQDGLLSLGLTAGFISILVTNFFGFAVVIISLYFFLIPVFVLLLNNQIKPGNVFVLGADERSEGARLLDKRGSGELNSVGITWKQWILLFIVLLLGIRSLATLYRFWIADQSYYLGFNYNQIGAYQQAYLKLHDAVIKRSDEPTFQDELSANDAIIATALSLQKEATSSAKLAEEAIAVSDHVTSLHPNNVVFWKTRTRVFYTLSQTDPKYLATALSAIEKAHSLAPTDAKISYNLGLLQGQNGQTQKAIETLKQTIKLKPDYRDAYYALGLFYRDLATDKNGKVKDEELEKMAVSQMHYILTHFATDDAQATQLLKNWGEE